MRGLNDPNTRNAEQTPLWDTYQLAKTTATPTKIVMFANATGTGATPLGKNLTNMPRPYQINPGDLFHLLAIRFSFINCDEADIVAFAQNYCLTFFMDNVPLIEAPTEFFPGGAGIHGTATTTAATTTIKQWTNGTTDPRAINAIASGLAVDFSGDDTIRVELNGTTFQSTAAIFARCYLDGVWEKAAQG